MSRSGPNPVIFMAATVLALSAGAGIGYWQFGNVQSVQADVNRLRAEVGSQNELENEVRLSAKRLQDGLNLITHLERNLTTVEYIPTLLKDLQQTGEACNLEIIGVRPVPIAPKTTPQGKDEEARPERKSYQEIDVEVRSKGSFENVMRFLRRLEDFPKIVAVRHVSVQPRPGPEGHGVAALETTMMIRVYVFPQATGNNRNAARASADAAGGEG